MTAADTDTDTDPVRVDVFRHPRLDGRWYFSVVIPGDYEAKLRDRALFGDHTDADGNPLRSAEAARAAGKFVAELLGYEVIR